MKSARQEKILEIIEKYEIETQIQLMERLRAEGVKSTQATLSRDLRTLGLVKQLEPNGVIHYAINPLSSEEDNDLKRLLHIARMAMLSAEAARNIIVIKTLPGLAGAVASVADKLEHRGLAGSIAGNDTILLIMKDDGAADELLQIIRDLVSGTRELP